MLPSYEPGCGESRQDAAEVSGVEVELATQIGHRDIVAMRQLEQHPRFGEPERRAGEVRLQQSEHTGVEAVESAHVVDHADHS